MPLVLDDANMSVLRRCTFLCLYNISFFSFFFLKFISTGLVTELSKTRRVRIAEEVILEDESKPKKKKKKDGGK